MKIAVLLDYWKKSLQMLAWKELRLALLATLNNFFKSCMTVVRLFPGVVLLFIASLTFTAMIAGYCIPSVQKLVLSPSVLNALFTGFLSHSSKGVPALCSPALAALSITQVIAFLLLAFSCLFLLFFYFLAARPSIEAKDADYFKKYTIKFWMFCLFCMMWLYCGALSFFFQFFLFDSGNRSQDLRSAVFKGIYCTLFFLPLALLLWIAVRLMGAFLMLPCVLLLYGCCPITCFFVCYFIVFFLTLFAISLYSIHYVKIKHTFNQLFS